METSLYNTNHNDKAPANEDESAIIAAIATALFEVTEDVHDIEPTILTFKKVEHSPWGSKIHGIREIPKK